MICVIPFCVADAKEALRLIDWIGDLGGCPGHKCLLVTHDDTPWDISMDCQKSAENSFSSVELITIDENNGGWIAGSCNLFRAAAKKCAGKPFLILDPDAVPLKTSWLDAIEKAYLSCGKPFMGPLIKHDNPKWPNPYLEAVSVYPPDAWERIKPFWNLTDFWFRSAASVIVPNSFDSQLIHHLWGQENNAPTFSERNVPKTNVLSLRQIKDGAVVFHRCKDGSLIRLLKMKRGIIEPSKITVVITNFKRPELLWDCFQSCQKANITNLVISSSGTNDELRKVHQRILDQQPETTISAIDNDLGCNEMWLRGVELAQTEWVHLLHDDDLILPEFNSLNSILRNDVGFYNWPAKRHEVGGPICNENHAPFAGHKTGIYSTNLLRPCLSVKNGLSISPVSGLFKRDHLIEVLRECEQIKDRFQLRPGMMIGNDLLIWLKALDKYKQFFYLDKPLISYGNWNGSTTWDDMTNRKGKLGPIYQAMREYALKKNSTYRPKRLIHCVELHTDTKSPLPYRKIVAKDSWVKLYQTGRVIPAHYIKYRRDSSSIGDNRYLPFLKDVLERGMSIAEEEDILMFTNDDSILHPQLPNAVLDMVGKYGACCCHRADCIRWSGLNGSSLFKPATDHPGRDMFAFSMKWIIEWWTEIPDFILGAPCWDMALAGFVRWTTGAKELNLGKNNQCWDRELPRGYVAHIMHNPTWNNPSTKNQSIANGYNNNLAEALMEKLYPDKKWGSLQWV